MANELFTYNPICFRVDGEPLPMPKKEIGRGKDGTPMLIGRDVKRRRDPVTGKQVVVSRGDKRRWVELVRATALQWMTAHGRKPFPKNHPVAMGCLFFLTKAKSNHLEYPSQDPDLDNLEYAVWNALKRTPAKRRDGGGMTPGRFPDGICFYDDCQIVWRLNPAGVLWADADNPPGVIISIADANTMTQEIAVATKLLAARVGITSWGTTFEKMGRQG
jgi:hypothetical protein